MNLLDELMLDLDRQLQLSADELANNLHLWVSQGVESAIEKLLGLGVAASALLPQSVPPPEAYAAANPAPAEFVPLSWKTDAGLKELTGWSEAAKAGELTRVVAPWQGKPQVVLQKGLAASIQQPELLSLDSNLLEVGRYAAKDEVKVLFANLPLTATLAQREQAIQTYGGPTSIFGGMVQAAYGVQNEGLPREFQVRTAQVQAKDGGWSTTYTLLDSPPRRNLLGQEKPIAVYQTPSRFLEVEPGADAAYNRAEALKGFVKTLGKETPGVLQPQHLVLTQAELETPEVQAALKALPYEVDAVAVQGATGAFGSLVMLNPDVLTHRKSATLAEELAANPGLVRPDAPAGAGRKVNSGDSVITLTREFDFATQGLQPSAPLEPAPAVAVGGPELVPQPPQKGPAKQPVEEPAPEPVQPTPELPPIANVHSPAFSQVAARTKAEELKHHPHHPLPEPNPVAAPVVEVKPADLQQAPTTWLAETPDTCLTEDVECDPEEVEEVLADEGPDSSFGLLDLAGVAEVEPKPTTAAEPPELAAAPVESELEAADAPVEAEVDQAAKPNDLSPEAEPAIPEATSEVESASPHALEVEPPTAVFAEAIEEPAPAVAEPTPEPEPATVPDAELEAPPQTPALVQEAQVEAAPAVEPPAAVEAEAPPAAAQPEPTGRPEVEPEAPALNSAPDAPAPHAIEVEPPSPVFAEAIEEPAPAVAVAEPAPEPASATLSEEVLEAAIEPVPEAPAPAAQPSEEQPEAARPEVEAAKEQPSNSAPAAPSPHAIEVEPPTPVFAEAIEEPAPVVAEPTPELAIERASAAPTESEPEAELQPEAPEQAGPPPQQVMLQAELARQEPAPSAEVPEAPAPQPMQSELSEPNPEPNPEPVEEQPSQAAASGTSMTVDLEHTAAYEALEPTWVEQEVTDKPTEIELESFAGGESITREQIELHQRMIANQAQYEADLAKRGIELPHAEPARYRPEL